MAKCKCELFTREELKENRCSHCGLKIFDDYEIIKVFGESD